MVGIRKHIRRLMIALGHRSRYGRREPPLSPATPVERPAGRFVDPDEERQSIVPELYFGIRPVRAVLFGGHPNRGDVPPVLKQNPGPSVG